MAGNQASAIPPVLLGDLFDKEKPMRIDTDVHLLKYRRTKIVATLGPASANPGVIERLIEAGVNVFRLNMSHGNHTSHREAFFMVRDASSRLGKRVGILADLCGPKIRVGRFRDGFIQLEEGLEAVVTTRDVEGSQGLIPSQYRDLHTDVRAGARILLDDGNLELVVREVDGPDIACTVVSGGKLKDHKGMNLPDIKVSAPSLTETDRGDALFALELGVDFLALSFVREGSDVRTLRDLIGETGSNTAIISKIEKPEALDNIDEIMQASDAVMVARGDLGVELPPQKVPHAQDRLIDLARHYRIPVIVATQMLESMIEHPRPTRAEVSDVSTAVRAGADAVMLSAETAAGRYPIQAVIMMDNIARQTEAYQWSRGAFGSFAQGELPLPPIPVEDAIARSTAQLSRDLMVRCIVVISRHNRSLSIMSSARPAAPIVGVSTSDHAAQMASLLWGVIPMTVTEDRMDAPRELAKSSALDFGLAESGQAILVVRGFSADPEENAPNVTVLTV